MLVAFRYDDCSATSSLDLERRLVELLAELGVQLTLGVIPRVCAGAFRDPTPQNLLALPSEKVSFLRSAAQAGHAEIALHGWSHQTWHSSHYAEFAGLPLHEQQRRIVSGQQELEDLTGARIRTFVPPWNEYDQHTLSVLEEQGFECLSGSLRGPFPQRSALRFLPYSCWLSDLSTTVKTAVRLRWLQSVIVVMLHDFDFVDSGKPQAWLTLRDLRSILERVRDRPDVQLCSVQEAVDAGGALSSEDLAPYQRWRQHFRNLPWRYRHLLEDQVYWTDGPGVRSRSAMLAYQAYLSLGVVSTDLTRALWSKLLRRTVSSAARSDSPRATHVFAAGDSRSSDDKAAT